MGAPNFGLLNNIDEYYVLDDETFECVYNSDVEEVAEDLKAVFQEQDERFEVNIIHNNEMNYPTVDLGYIEKGFSFLGISIEIHYNVYIQAGYYSDSNLDFEYKLYLNWDRIKMYDAVGLYDVIDEIETELEYYGINKGLWAMNKEKLEKKLLKLDDEMREKIKKAFKEISCCQVERVAGFSNGEAIYMKIES